MVSACPKYVSRHPRTLSITSPPPPSLSGPTGSPTRCLGRFCLYIPPPTPLSLSLNSPISLSAGKKATRRKHGSVSVLAGGGCGGGCGGSSMSLMVVPPRRNCFLPSPPPHHPAVSAPYSSSLPSPRLTLVSGVHGPFVQCCFTSTETIKTIRDGEPRTSTTTFTQLWSSDLCPL